MTPQSSPMLSPSPRPRQYRPPQAINPRQPSRLPHLLLRPQPKARSPSFLLPLNLPVPLLRPRIPSTPSDHRDRFPDESVETLLGRLEAFLNENFDALTDKHCEWILSQARKSHDRQGVLKMLGYSEKVVRNASAVASASA